MGSAKIEIINNALGELGQPALSSLSQVSLAAETAEVHYDDTKEDLLGKADWRFAVKKATLSREVDAPLNEWLYQFLLPADFLRLVKLEPREHRFEIFGTKIFTDAPSLDCDYVHKASETLFPSPFVRLLSLELAVRMCMVLTGDIDLKTGLQGDARLQFAAALAADAMQRPNQRISDAPFVNVRW